MTKERTENSTTVKIVASVLAAATAAVLSFRLNVVGTVIGAVVASAVTTVGAVLYERSMKREKKWQAIAVGGLLVLTVSMLTVTSVQLVRGTPVKAESTPPPAPTVTEKVVERSTETIKELSPTTASSQPPTESTTTTGPPTSTTNSSTPSSSSAPPTTVNTIR